MYNRWYEFGGAGNEVGSSSILEVLAFTLDVGLQNVVVGERRYSLVNVAGSKAGLSATSVRRQLWDGG
jgi:hypothetical protein